jgi:hypothetical protein
MEGQDAAATSTDTFLVTEAYSAARELLRQAEEDAARMRADADRYVRQREQEAGLLVAKARRLLAMAEQRAIDLRPVVVDVDAPAPREPEDVDLLLLDELDAAEPVKPGTRRTRSDLDSILANAVRNAIDRSLPAER